MAGEVPIQKRPMEVVAEADVTGFKARLRRILAPPRDISSFIVWSEIADGAHGRHRKMLLNALTEFHPDLPPSFESFDFTNTRQEPEGILHHDMADILHLFNDATEEVHEGPFTLPTLHTTNSGAGDVWVARIGTSIPKVMAFQGINTAWALGSDDMHNPHYALLYGVADPELVNPIVEKGYARPGVSVVTAGDCGRFAVWHRYDTAANMGVRAVEACMVYPVDGLVRGYDLP